MIADDRIGGGGWRSLDLPQAKDEMREIEFKKKNRFGIKEIQADNEKMANADLEKLDTSLEAKGKTRKIL